MSLYGPTFRTTPLDLCINFQCKNIYIYIYKSCTMSSGNKLALHRAKTCDTGGSSQYGN